MTLAPPVLEVRYLRQNLGAAQDATGRFITVRVDASILLGSPTDPRLWSLVEDALGRNARPIAQAAHLESGARARNATLDAICNVAEDLRERIAGTHATTRRVLGADGHFRRR